MTCTYCGTALPAGALFCGECGRAVAGYSHRGDSRPGVDPDGAATAVPSLVEPGAHGIGIPTCAQCGAPMAEDDIFCGECGFVSRAASEDFGSSRDTAIIVPVPRAPAIPRPPIPRLVDRVPDFEPATRSGIANAMPESVIPLAAPSPTAPASPAPASPASVESGASRAAPFDESADLEATRISRAGRTGERFVLQFSTGESFTVYGTGLIGRNPRSEPNEYFDQLVRVLDPSRSVSKVHLEFGQDGGIFWIMDRFSGNGTIIREPDSAAARCQPNRRYRLSRGTRVEIGEQFFIVS